MIKSMQEAATERRDYVNQIRASFYPPETNKTKYASSYSQQGRTLSERATEEGEIKFSSLGLRTMIAILIFAAFVYCDKEQITFHQYKTQDILKQIEWNPLPTDEIENILKISLKSSNV